MSLIRIRFLNLDGKTIGYRVNSRGNSEYDYDISAEDLDYFLELTSKHNIMFYATSLEGYVEGDTFRVLNEENVISLETKDDIYNYVKNIPAYSERTKDSTVVSCFLSCRQKLLDIGIPLGSVHSVRVNSRLSSTHGRCERKRTQGIFNIEISDTLVSHGSKEGLETVMIHELLHTCRDSFKHTGTWKYYADLVRYKLGYNITTYSSKESLGIDVGNLVLSEGLYACKCDTCGSVVTRKSASKFILHPELYICSCGGRFYRIS